MGTYGDACELVPINIQTPNQGLCINTSVDTSNLNFKSLPTKFTNDSIPISLLPLHDPKCSRQYAKQFINGHRTISIIQLNFPFSIAFAVAPIQLHTHTHPTKVVEIQITIN